MNITTAKAITGGGINACNGKMPGASYALPASACKVGSKLAEIAGTVCSKCYVMRGNYLFPGPQLGMARRLASISDPRWVDAMVTLILHNFNRGPRSIRMIGRGWDKVKHEKMFWYFKQSKNGKYFRWHDSGDIQSVEHLEKIATIARRCPRVKFWLPTRELAFVRIWALTHSCPANLTIRLSAHLIDGPHPITLASQLGLNTSGVHKNENAAIGKICTARKRGNACGPCRACWDKSVSSISYPIH